MAANDGKVSLSLNEMLNGGEKGRTSSEEEPSSTALKKSFQPYHAQSVPKSEDLEATAFERQSSGEATEVTTMMLRNIPNKYTQNSLLQEIKDLGFAGTFDFFYLPMDVHNRSNVGYAFINFFKPQDAERFRSKFSDHRFQRFQSRKISSVCTAHVQGLFENLRHFENRAVTHARNDQYRPVVLRDGVRVDIEVVLSDRKLTDASSPASSETRAGDSRVWSRQTSFCSSEWSNTDGQEGTVGTTTQDSAKGKGKGSKGQKVNAGSGNWAGPTTNFGSAAAPKSRAQQPPLQRASPTPRVSNTLEEGIRKPMKPQSPGKLQQPYANDDSFVTPSVPPGLARGNASLQQNVFSAAAALMTAGQPEPAKGNDITQLLSLRSLLLDRLPKDGVNQIQAYQQAAALLAMQQQQQMQQLQQQYQMHLQAMSGLSPLSPAFCPSSSSEEPAYISVSPTLRSGKSSLDAVGSGLHSGAWDML